METFDAIKTRKSIRKYQDKDIPQEVLDRILTAATLAPSGKNKQPWKFYVVRGEKRAEMVQEMQKGMDRLGAQGINTGSARYTIRVMAQAPVTILVFNPFSRHPLLTRNTQEVYGDMVDIQSIGASIQNMLLEATALGVGSLWICDVYFGYEELCDWVGEKGELVAAVSLGYADHTPRMRPRKPVGEVTVYVE
ncbi:MAG: nitroreductase family protein [Anaerolineaceae bacterium]|nr:nitroreductase family protein [Anaerolineaceae bacterium]